MTHRLRAALCAVGAVLLLGACAADPIATPSPTRVEESPSPGGETAPGASPATASITEEGLAALVAAAAESANVGVQDVRVLTAERVTWADVSLGCPRPGQGYTQALVPGFRVVLEIDGEQHYFHAAEGGDFTFCDDPQPPVEGGGG